MSWAELVQVFGATLLSNAGSRSASDGRDLQASQVVGGSMISRATPEFQPQTRTWKHVVSESPNLPHYYTFYY